MVRMAKFFKVGDRVTWRSEAGRASGTITKVHLEDFQYEGRTQSASKDHPKYEIRSDTSGQVEVHNGSALRRAER